MVGDTNTPAATVHLHGHRARTAAATAAAAAHAPRMHTVAVSTPALNKASEAAFDHVLRHRYAGLKTERLMVDTFGGS